jgi:very-short-patch-repair endonuclease
MIKASPQNNYLYNPALKELAQSLRNSMTKAECCLWKYVLKARKMNGYQFLRQRPVLDYIADFMCKELLLIIEVDGISHQFDDVEINDLKRQQKLEQVGFTVLRFQDGEILNNIGDVIYAIENWVNQNARK